MTVAAAPRFLTSAYHLRFVDGKPRLDGVRGFLGSRGITPADGGPGDTMRLTGRTG